MFGIQSQKVVAVQEAVANKAETNAHQAVLESLYIYGVLLQLQRYADLDFRDYATMGVPDKKQLDTHTFEAGQRRQVAQLCENSRAQILFVGKAELVAQTLKVQYRFYDPTTNQYELVNGQLDAKLGGNVHAPETLDAYAFNSLIDQTALALLKVIAPSNIPADGQLTSLTHKLGALRSLLQAHWSSDTSDKILCFQQAIQADSTVESAYAHLGRIYRNNGDYAKSVLCYRNALQVASGGARNRAVYATEGGISCALLGKMDLTIQWWEQAIVYDPQYLNPYLNLGNLFEDQNKLDLAADYFAKGAALAPDDSRTFSSLARIYSKQGKWSKALAQYEHQLDIDGEDAWCHSDIATCHLNLGNVRVAQEHLERTAALDPQGEAGQYAELILSGLAISQDAAS